MIKVHLKKKTHTWARAGLAGGRQKHMSLAKLVLSHLDWLPSLALSLACPKGMAPPRAAGSDSAFSLPLSPSCPISCYAQVQPGSSPSALCFPVSHRWLPCHLAAPHPAPPLFFCCWEIAAPNLLCSPAATSHSTDQGSSAETQPRFWHLSSHTPLARLCAEAQCRSPCAQPLLSPSWFPALHSLLSLSTLW